MTSSKRSRTILVFSVIAGIVSIFWLLERRWSQWFAVVQSGKSNIEGHDGKVFQGSRVTIQSLLACSSEQAWELALTSGLMHHVSWPLLMMRNIKSGMPDEWVQGDILKVRLYTFRIIPLGEHTVHIRTVNRDQGIIQSHEYGDLIQALDHTIQIEPFGRNLTLYTDDVLINAGIFTPFLAWGVRFFYRYRQSRWQHIARQWERNEGFGFSEFGLQ